MKIKILIILLLVCIIIGVLFIIQDNNKKEDIPKSLAEMFYEKGSENMERYFEYVDEKIDLNGFGITVDEYFVDCYSGVGMIKCTFPIEHYNEDRNILYIKTEFLLSCDNQIITDEDNVYCYYKFILNEEGLNQKSCKIYFDIASESYFYELNFDYDVEHIVFCEENGDKITVSLSGAVEQRRKDKDGKNIVISVDSEKVSNVYQIEDDEKVYVLYQFSEFLDITTINTLSELYEMIKSGNNT